MAQPVVAPRFPVGLTVSRITSGLGWTAVVLASLYFVQRDALRYLDYSPEGFRHHWELRAWLIPHILGGGSSRSTGSSWCGATC